MIPQIVIGQAYQPLLTSTDTIIGVEGNRGSGKTRAILSILMCRALQYPGSRWALWRSKRTRLSETVLNTLENEVFPAFGMKVPGKAGAPNRSSYNLFNGSKFIPIGLDDVNRGTSAGFAGGYLNEGIELPRREQAEALLGTLREATVPFHQLIIDFNPGAPNHWINKACEPVPEYLQSLPNNRAEYDRVQAFNQAPARHGFYKRLLSSHQDNPGYFNLPAWAYTTLGNEYVHKILGRLSGHLRQRWLNRVWAAAEGVVFKQFNAATHTITPFDLPRNWPCVLSYDPGYDHPAAIVVTAISPSYVIRTDVNGQERRLHQLYIVGEHIEREQSIEQIAAAMTRLCKRFNVVKKFGDPHDAFKRTQGASGRTIAQQLKALGHSIVPAKAANNPEELVAQVEEMRDYLTTLSPLHMPLIEVFSDCTGVIDAYQSWSYKRNQAGEITGSVDQFDEPYKDPIDAVRQVTASDPAGIIANLPVMRR